MSRSGEIILKRRSLDMIKQCGYCYRVYGTDGEYHDIGLTEPVVEIYVAPPKKQKVRVSHAVCAECFEVMMSTGQKDSGSEAVPAGTVLTDSNYHLKAS
jgi:hypothetical protein